MVHLLENYDAALDFLRKRPVENRHLIGFLHMRPACPGVKVYADALEHPHGVMVRTDHVTGTAVRNDADIDADDLHTFDALIDSLAVDEYQFTFTRRWMIRRLLDRFRPTRCTRDRYMHATPESFTNRATLGHARMIRELRESDRPQAELYPADYPNLLEQFDYTTQRWQEGERGLRMLGFFEQDSLAAWVQFWMGAGMCEVMNIHTHPEHRRRGYGAALLSLATLAIFKNHTAAYYNVGGVNAASYHLARSVGYRHQSYTFNVAARLR